MQLPAVTLEDKYTLLNGRVFLSATQALVRLPMLQRERDLAAGLDTGGLISGYRGSPLGSYDKELWEAAPLLKRHNIRFQPGLNEDLAATAIWGSQQVGMVAGATVDGVFGIWYGKGFGVDRSVDVFKHANSAGSSRHGGVLVVAGDDHGATSSWIAHQSEQVFMAAMIPVLNPASVQEYLDFGLYGFALSRFSGCWVGFKAISETLGSSASVEIDPQRVPIHLPQDFEMPPDGLNIRWPDLAPDSERRLHGPKMAAVAAFARANTIDRLVFDAPQARLGILAAGKGYLDVRQALADLGLDEDGMRSLGIRLYKPGLTWPLEETGALRFAQGLADVLVVEEKRDFIESQLVRILYHMEPGRRPSVVGRRDESGPLLPSTGELTPVMVARAIVKRLRRLGVERPDFVERLARMESFERVLQLPLPKVQRTASFCSGCPHNTSTRVPAGSRALAGIGCHTMALRIPSRNTQFITQMGGEGANWIGQAGFTREKHVFQNLGDGTYMHSGLLAVRAAVAAGVNITYKILFNDAVAMTGGQPVEGQITVPRIVQQLLAEGVTQVTVVTDEPAKYARNALPAATPVRHRSQLDEVQRQLRDMAGVTALVYDQTCAAEKRRRRKKGLYPDPPRRVFINEAVCEGCGDCSEASNCISLAPHETELGRKRRISQSNCNKDFSCIDGFCPSFVTVHGGSLRRLAPSGRDPADGLLAALPQPQPAALERPYSILVTGIGGTGVITIGALLGMAAHLEGKACTILDFTGVAQKNGAVMSHVRLAGRPDELHAVRIAAGSADLVLACDMLVAVMPQALARMAQGVTRAVVNSDLQPTAAFALDPDLDFDAPSMRRTLADTVGATDVDFLDATTMATALLGDAIATNLFMLGYAWQKGLVPLGREAIERAVELNAAAVESNKLAFAWGRLAAHDCARVREALRPLASEPSPRPRSAAELLEDRARRLTEYQDAAYAQRYRDAVVQAQAAEQARVPGSTAFAEAVARQLYRLMAYKDEYEVARLYTNGGFTQRLREQFDGDVKLTFHLAPPLFAARDPATGRLRKRAYGPWMFTVMKMLARLKALRGSPFDPFGHTAERRTERRLIGEYEEQVRELAAQLTPANHALAVEIASVPERIRGFGHVKEKNLTEATRRQDQLLTRFRQLSAATVVSQRREEAEDVAVPQ
ncbi:MAG: indolepyruvate ferredoxin oxidoreductase family protein [Burkholderiaceae bacterium]|nr:indolepyruvate ferredoxin oxidoreductase family protein [Burkholderiaceae bacterium]